MNNNIAITTQRLIELDVPNKNLRIYSRETVEQVIEKFKDKKCFGRIGMPTETVSIDLMDVSHMVENLRIEDGFLIGDIKILNTPNGKILRRLSESVSIAYRTAGTARVIDNKIVDFVLISINALPESQAA